MILNYYIGVDGGGSKTRIVLLDQNLKLIREKEIEASNLVSTDYREVLNKINQIIKEYQHQYNIRGIGLGMAGIDSEQERSRLERKLAATYPDKEVRVCNDGVASLIGGLNYQTGILINAGTGSIAVGIDREGTIYRAGGWDYLLGDEGSGFWIGKKLIQRAIVDYDRGIVDSIIVHTVKKFFRLTSLSALVTVIHQQGINKEKIATLAPLAAELAEGGEQRAGEIFERAGKELAVLVERVYRRGKFNTPVALTYNGSIFKSFSLFRDSFFHYLQSKSIILNWQQPQYPAEIGAALIIIQGNRKLQSC